MPTVMTGIEDLGDRWSDNLLAIRVWPAVLVVALSAAAWASSLARADFWADDFVNLALYNHSLGDLTDLDRNDGKYTINFFWAWGTDVFGTGSATPFLLTVSGVFILGLFFWLKAGSARRWSTVASWWIAAALCASATPFGILLWSSNIVHAVALLSLAVGLGAHERIVLGRLNSSDLRWSFIGGSAWLLAVVSNPMYIGFLVLSAYLAWEQIRGWVLKSKRSSRRTTLTIASILGWNVLIPLMYFIFVAYPKTVEAKAYATSGFGFIPDNLRFYSDRLAPTTGAYAVYVGLIVVTLLACGIAVSRSDVFPTALLTTGAAVALPVLMQGQQRNEHYLVIPLLLVLCALAAAARAIRPLIATRLSPTLGTAAISLILLMLLSGGQFIRNYWVSTPLGSELTDVRKELAQEAPPGSNVCIELALTPERSARFIPSIGGNAGFLMPPLSAASARFGNSGGCGTTIQQVVITISTGPGGQLVARPGSISARP